MKKCSSSIDHPYKTDRLTFAAYMLVTGKAELLDTETVPGSHNVIFILSKCPSSEDVTGFFYGSAEVPALKYAEAINTLKGVAYEIRRSNGNR